MRSCDSNDLLPPVGFQYLNGVSFHALNKSTLIFGGMDPFLYDRNFELCATSNLDNVFGTITRAFYLFIILRLCASPHVPCTPRCAIG